LVLRTKVRLTLNIVPRVLVERDLHIEDLGLRLVGDIELKFLE